MNIVKLPGGRFLKSILAVGLLLGLSAVWAPAQDQSASPAQTPQNQNQNQDQDQGQKQPDKSVQPAQAPPEDKEIKITPRQAQELFHSVDEILAFDSKASGLPVKRRCMST